MCSKTLGSSVYYGECEFEGGVTVKKPLIQEERKGRGKKDSRSLEVKMNE